VDGCQVRGAHPERVAQARARLATEETYHGVAELFAALADPTRAKIVHALLHQELCTCDLAALTGVTESGISQHLRILRALCLVRARRAGKYVYHRLDDAHVAFLMQVGLTHQGHAEVELEAVAAVGRTPAGERWA
jgi:ArsR family transcriptional regulator